MDGMTFGLFVVGLLLLVGGAELLVRGASKLAAAVGISPLVIGLTVVAYGTSTPELAVSVQSALLGQADVAMGNVVGSNIANVLLILGIAALIAPLVVAQQLVRWDVPLMIGVSLLLWLFSLDGMLGKLDGLLLFSGAIIYTVLAIRQSRRESKAVQAEYAQAFGNDPTPQRTESVLLQLLFIGLGIGLLVIGARWLVDGAVMLAHTMGVSELVIGLTVVAVGTSLPELATSVVAALRGERDIAVGNVIGSNLFNIMAVLGLASLTAPEGVRVSPAVLAFDIPVMLAVAVACLPIFVRGYSIERWEGALFIGYYVAYTAYLILASVHHDALPMFSAVMLLFVIPLTAITLVVLALRAQWTARAQATKLPP